MGALCSAFDAEIEEHKKHAWKARCVHVLVRIR